jgi:hypothetical protein
MTINKSEARQTFIYGYINRVPQIDYYGCPARKQGCIDRDSLASRFVIFDDLSAMSFMDVTKDV